MLDKEIELTFLKKDTPSDAKKTKRKPGSYQGEFELPDDFNEFDSELEEMFYGK